MLKPRNITFYNMMLAGYLSAKAYRALKPKKQMAELSFSDCYGFEPDISNELKRLFEDEELKSSIYCLEIIENSINFEWETIHKILNLCMEKLDSVIINQIHSIGEKKFVRDYIFCTNDCFKQLNHVTKDNFSDLFQVKKEFATLYKDYIEKGALPEGFVCSHTPTKFYTDNILEESFMVNEPFGDYSIISGKGFGYPNNFIIDDDALGINNTGCKKYVLYLYSLDSEQFFKFEHFMLEIVSNCSVRLCNAIRSTGYRNFYVNFLFADELKFFQIRNFGKKSLFEFNSIKPQIINYVINEYNHGNTESVVKEIKREQEKKKYESLTLKEKVGEIQYALLINLLKTLISNVSVRTQNGINNYKGDFIEDFVHKTNDVKTIKHIGKKSELEFKLIISQLREAYKKLEQRELTAVEEYWIERNSLYGGLIDEYCHDFFNKQGHLPMFHLLSNCLSILIKEKSIKVLNAIIPLNSNEEANQLEDVAKKHNLTRERIRQISIKAINNLSQLQNVDDSNIPTYHTLLNHKEDWAYVLEKISKKELWEIDDISNIIQNEGCSINSELVLVVLSILFPDQYAIVGKTPLTISPRSNGWSKSYLVSKRLTTCFDFDSMIEIVRDYEKNNTESTTVSVQELLMDTFYNAWKQYDFSIEEKLEQVVGHFLVEELGLIPDFDFNYTLNGKKEEDPADVVYNLLKSSGNPLTINELYNQFNRILPDKYRSGNSLRALIYRDPRLCLLGANNMVALSEWEHIQTGSIRQLIVSYLAEFDSPQHIKDIVEYILQHRDTSERSISSTMGSGDQFVKFAGGYYGLADRSYAEWFSLSETERFSRKRIIDIEDFIKEHMHFPFCPSDNKDEENLYQWWNRMKRNKNISDTLLQEISRIELTYHDAPRNKSDFLWLNTCHRYRDFVIANGRQPSTRNTAENDLAKWFSRALDDVADGKLSSLREKEFINLCKSL